ncbi:hypothetical protein MHZ93_02065 [Roseomonas sp. ACRSG]|nr:hypothetical protein [Roseomonas sp. ACRSG]
MTRIASPLLLLLALGLAACQSEPPPSRPVSRAPTRPAPPVPSEVEGAWSFSVLGDRCSARVAHRQMTLAVSAGPAEKASFSLTAPGRGLPVNRPVRIDFRGDGGNWQLPGRTNGSRVASASTPLNEAGEARIRDLLGGGTVRASGSGVSAPALSVPDAGVSGRDWYGCLARLAQGAATKPDGGDAAPDKSP